MSIQFNNVTTRKGLVQFYEKETGRDFGVVSGSTARLKDFAADTAVALDELFSIGSQASGTFQIDDSNHLELPIFRFNIVSGQRTYTFLEDEQGNLILDFQKVMLAGPDGIYKPLVPRDAARELNVTPFIDGRETPGVPTQYDKLANGIRFDLVPNYSLTGGGEIYFSREPLYFAYTDTDKMAGIPGNLHPYLYIHPAEAYARRKGLKNLKALQTEKYRLEELIRITFARRPKDEVGGAGRNRMRPITQNNR